jgi:hypothetical protein
MERKMNLIPGSKRIVTPLVYAFVLSAAFVTQSRAGELSSQPHSPNDFSPYPLLSTHDIANCLSKSKDEGSKQVEDVTKPHSIVIDGKTLVICGVISGNLSVAAYDLTDRGTFEADVIGYPDGHVTAKLSNNHQPALALDKKGKPTFDQDGFPIFLPMDADKIVSWVDSTRSGITGTEDPVFEQGRTVKQETEDPNIFGYAATITNKLNLRAMREIMAAMLARHIPATYSKPSVSIRFHSSIAL